MSEVRESRRSEEQHTRFSLPAFFAAARAASGSECWKVSREISMHVRWHANRAETAYLVTRDQIEPSPRRLDHPLGQPVRHVLRRPLDNLDRVEFFLGVDGVRENPVFVRAGEAPFRRGGVRSRVGRARIGSSRQSRGRNSGVAVCDVDDGSAT